MAQRAIQASFYRGGTSRGLVFRADTLAPFTQKVRDNIIRRALGSPDPAKRQIDGLGGGVSSLSKACIIGAPGEALSAQKEAGLFPGVEWADIGSRASLGGSWDVVYRFCQVGVNTTTMDWSATCGNMLAAVALASIEHNIIPYTTLFTRARSISNDFENDAKIMLPMHILSASEGSLMHARVPLHPITLQLLEPNPGEGCKIAGVPGEGPGIELEMPIRGGMPTGSPLDSVDVDGASYPISVFTTGLPNIFVDISSLGFDESLLVQPAAALASHPISALLEKIRCATAQKYKLPLSLASPKIVLVGNIPTNGYKSTSGSKVTMDQADILARAISSGDWHATVPASTLAALNVGLAAGSSVPATVSARQRKSFKSSPKTMKSDTLTVKCAHSAGVVTSTIRFDSRKNPQSVLMTRTAREIMRGSVMVPERDFE